MLRCLPRVGIEPTAARFSAWRSTTELPWLTINFPPITRPFFYAETPLICCSRSNGALVEVRRFWPNCRALNCRIFISLTSWLLFETFLRFLFAAFALKAATLRVLLKEPQVKPKCHFEGETTFHFLPLCTLVLCPRWCLDTSPPLDHIFNT